MIASDRPPLRRAGAAALLSGLVAAAPAAAHPHVFIEVKSEIVFDGAGKLAAVRHAWRFDEGYSAFATQGLDADGDGTLTVAELQPLAEINIESMVDYDYFTFVTAGEREIALAKPTEYWLQSDGGLLTLYFTVPLAEAAEIRSLPASVEVYDPTFFVAFDFLESGAVDLVDAPSGCRHDITRPEELDPAAAAALAEIGPDQRDLPPDLQLLTVGQVNGVQLACP
jgi:ABC-type uncharacterized transport system substrate-binding protein